MKDLLRRCGGFKGALAALTLLMGSEAAAQQGSVAGTLHNLSVSGPGEIRSMTETQVCKFCHTPHNAVEPVPLWGHALSDVKRYVTPLLQGSRKAAEEAPQPDGASRLCLSCHDGTVALGDLGSRRSRVPMQGATRIPPGRRGFIGTDLSGSHPVSIVMEDHDHGLESEAADMRLRPAQAVRNARGPRLDKQGKIQCTTCHDPHSDAYYREGLTPHFWVGPTVTEVCLECHELR